VEAVYCIPDIVHVFMRTYVLNYHLSGHMETLNGFGVVYWILVVD
jgi:hypothetical protein